MKRYIKQKIKHKVKLFLTRVSVRQMKKQHSETKRLVKRRKKENRNRGEEHSSLVSDLEDLESNFARIRGDTSNDGMTMYISK